jgi:hypothetical protein
LDKIEKLFPPVYIHFIERINGYLLKILVPTKTSLVFLMMFIGISGSSFFVDQIYYDTMIYNILYILSKPMILILNILNLA